MTNEELTGYLHSGFSGLEFPEMGGGFTGRGPADFPQMTAETNNQGQPAEFPDVGAYQSASAKRGPQDQMPLQMLPTFPEQIPTPQQPPLAAVAPMFPEQAPAPQQQHQELFPESAQPPGETPATFPDLSGVQPSPTDTRFPETPNQSPATDTRFPETPNQSPATDTRFPETPNQSPADQAMFPETPNQSPPGQAEFPQTPGLNYQPAQMEFPAPPETPSLAAGQKDLMGVIQEMGSRIEQMASTITNLHRGGGGGGGATPQPQVQGMRQIFSWNRQEGYAAGSPSVRSLNSGGLRGAGGWGHYTSSGQGTNPIDLLEPTQRRPF